MKYNLAVTITDESGSLLCGVGEQYPDEMELKRMMGSLQSLETHVKPLLPKLYIKWFTTSNDEKGI